MAILRVDLTDDEALAILHATGRVQRLPKNHTRNLLSAERKILAVLSPELAAEYRATIAGKDKGN